MLAVSDPPRAIEFYRQAFDAEVRWCIGEPPEVAGLAIGGAEFFLARENPPKTLGPDHAGHTTVRIELFVDDPQATHDRAVAAGARVSGTVAQWEHATAAGTTLRMLQGSVVDPFGHRWLIGRFLD